jgi:hypothetical protein
MWAKEKALVLSAVLQAVPFASADNASLASPPPPATQEMRNRALSHIDYLGNGLFAVKEKSVRAEPAFRTEDEDAPRKITRFNVNPPTGLHRAISDQRPALEYRLSDQGAIRIHTGRHNAGVVAAWSF